MSGEASVTKSQLDLLMGSYRDSVELNTKLLGKIDSVLDVQKESCQGINKLCEKINDQTSTLVTHNIQLSDKLARVSINLMKEHNSIKSRLYVAFSLMGTIIIGLLTTIYKIFIP